MLWGAILGIFIGYAVIEIQDISMHQGSVIVWHEEYEEEEIVSEDQYKRKYYTNVGLVLIFLLGVWIFIAYNEKTKADKNLDYIGALQDYLYAKMRTDSAYQDALAKVMGNTTYDTVTNEAKKDPIYEAAKATEKSRERDYDVTSRAYSEE